MSRFAGKRAVVTGAGSGIGAAVAHRLEADGSRRRRRRPHRTVVQLDVTDEPQVAAAVRDVDVLVNVAAHRLDDERAVPSMIERGGGSIVNVASVAALVDLRNRAAYCASKRRGSRWDGSGRPT
jgi:2-keto-3-deoxy-L-fuconate dehydrogenase